MTSIKGVRGSSSSSSSAAAAEAAARAAAEARRRAEEARRLAAEARRRAEEARREAAQAARAAAAAARAHQSPARVATLQGRATAAEGQARIRESEADQATTVSRTAMAEANALATRQGAPAPYRRTSELRDGFDTPRGRRQTDVGRPPAAAPATQGSSATAAFTRLGVDPGARAAMERLGIRDGTSLQAFGERLARAAQDAGAPRRSDRSLDQARSDPAGLATLIAGAGAALRGGARALLSDPGFARAVAEGQSPGDAARSRAAGGTTIPGARSALDSPLEINPSAGDFEIGASGSVEGSAESGRLSAHFEVSFDASLEQNIVREDGFTTVTVSAEISGTAAGGISLQGRVVGVSADASVTAGETVTYQVRLSDADFARLRAGEIPLPDPNDPASLPVGGSIRLDQEHFTGTSLDVGLSVDGLDLGLGTEQTLTHGSAVLLQRTEYGVRVSAGPTETLDNIDRASIGPLSSRSHLELVDSVLRSAEFSLSAGGRRALASFTSSGRLPNDNGGGVRDVQTIHRRDYDQTHDASIFGLSLGDPSSITGDLVEITLPDGRMDRVVNIEYGAGHIELEQRFSSDGTELEDSRHYTLSFDQLSSTERGLLVEAFSGDFAAGEAAMEGEGTVELSFSTEQLAALGERMRAWVEVEPTAFGEFVERVSHFTDPVELALAIVRDTASEDAKARNLLRLSQAQDPEHRNLPGQVHD